MLYFEGVAGYEQPSGADGSDGNKFPSPGSDFLPGKSDSKVTSPEFCKLESAVTVSPKQLSFGELDNN